MMLLKFVLFVRRNMQKWLICRKMTVLCKVKMSSQVKEIEIFGMFSVCLILSCISEIRLYSYLGEPHRWCNGSRALASSAVHREFELWSRQANDYKIGICCFSAERTSLMRKNNDWLARNQDDVSDWNNTF